MIAQKAALDFDAFYELRKVEAVTWLWADSRLVRSILEGYGLTP